MPSVEELLSKEYPPPKFLVNPYVAQGGITFLYGKTGVGKSPFTWEMARCVTTGTPFLGLGVTQASKVLYLDRETDESLIVHRLHHLPKPVGNWKLECLIQRPISDAFKYGAEQEWDLVIWNSLRKFIGASNPNSGETVPAFYDSLHRHFPGAAHVLIAHDRKSSLLTEKAITAPEREEFSGSMAWLDQAQVGIHITSRPGYYEVTHVKSQVTRLRTEHVKFVVEEEGGTARPWIRVPGLVEMIASAPGKNMREKVAWVAAQTGKSERTVWRAIQDAGGDTQVCD